MKGLCILGLALFLLAKFSQPTTCASLNFPPPPTNAVILPPTNALNYDLKILPRVIEPNAFFGSHVAQKSNVVVFGYSTLDSASTNIPLFDVYQSTAAGLVFQASIPRLVNPVAVYDLTTDGHRIAIAAAEGVLPTIYLYKQINNQWTFESTLHPSSPVWSISISGETIVAGSSMKALVLQRDNTDWKEQVLLPPSDAPSDVKNGFGADVAIDRDSILIGARGQIRGDPGRAYVFARDVQQWRLEAELLPEQSIFTPFGGVVALDGDTAMVTAGPTRFNGGFVYWYRRSHDGWTRKGSLSGLDTHDDLFGHSLSISGRNLVVGAPWDHAEDGVIYLFRENGAAMDRFQIYYHDDYGLSDLPDANLGKSIAVDGDTIIAGAPYYDGFALNVGIAAVFQFKFGVALGSPYVRTSDKSFHFIVTDAIPGLVYTLETAAALDADWSTVKEFTAYDSDMQFQVDYTAETSATFFRLHLKE